MTPAVIQNEILNKSTPSTIAIDITIGGMSDPIVKNILGNAQVQEAINSGTLNLVFFRNAQKFDMLGFDNYNGGMISAFNNGKPPWDTFNNHLKTHELSNTDHSYQELCVLQQCCIDQINSYQQKIQQNTKKIYDTIFPSPQIESGRTGGSKSKPQEKTRGIAALGDPDNPLCHFIENQDTSSCFLHMVISKDNLNRLEKLIAENPKYHSIAHRSSFGFLTPTYSPVQDMNQYHVRWSPGVTDPQLLIDLFTEFTSPTTTPKQVAKKPMSDAQVTHQQ